MKPIITLLLLAPGLACAQPTQNFSITSGSPIVLQAQADGVPSFTIAGSGFSGQVSMSFITGNPLFENPFPPGGLCCPLISGNTTEFSLDMGLTINGAPWTDAPTDPNGGGANAFLMWSPTAPINRAGAYSGQFSFFASYHGAPLAEYTDNGPLQCTNICRTLDFNGFGTGTIDVTPYPNVLGALLVTQATFTFKAPEPPTIALLLLGFAGVAVLGRRRRSSAT